MKKKIMLIIGVVMLVSIFIPTLAFADGYYFSGSCTNYFNSHAFNKVTDTTQEVAACRVSVGGDLVFNYNYTNAGNITAKFYVGTQNPQYNKMGKDMWEVGWPTVLWIPSRTCVSTLTGSAYVQFKNDYHSGSRVYTYGEYYLYGGSTQREITWP